MNKKPKNMLEVIEKNNKIGKNLIGAAVIIIIALSFSFKAYANNEVDDPEAKRKIIAEQLQATFAQTTFTNLEPSPIEGWWQAEISSQVVYFSPAQELIIFGEVYTKNGRSLSEETRYKWQTAKMKQTDFSKALIIGEGPVEIIEFSDPDCPFCQRFNDWAELKNTEYKTTNGGDLFTRKIIMTPIAELHPNAHKEAIHILCQEPEQQKQTMTNMLNIQGSYADLVFCEEGSKTLEEHLEIAKKMGVGATPTLIINNQTIQGFNKARIEQAIKQILNKQGGE